MYEKMYFEPEKSVLRALRGVGLVWSWSWSWRWRWGDVEVEWGVEVEVEVEVEGGIEFILGINLDAVYSEN